jgi:hypothetical protein
MIQSVHASLARNWTGDVKKRKAYKNAKTEAAD